MRNSDSNLKYSHRPESMNGFEEVVEFLPATNTKKVEKRGPRRKYVVIGVVLGAALLSLTVGLLVWHFAYRNARVQKMFTGSLRITNYPFIDAYENSTTPEFNQLAEKVTDMLKTLYSGHPDIAPYFSDCSVTAFSEGSVIAYYWAEFAVPAYREEALDKAISELKVQNVNLRRSFLAVDSFESYPIDFQLARKFRDNSCNYFLHAKPGELTKFSSPGFPNSPYPPNTRCQWVLRADVDHIISLKFKTFKMDTCNLPRGDYVKLYDSLSIAEARTMMTLCGSYPPSYNLTFFSSQNVMLITMVSDDKGRQPGFMAEFKQQPSTMLCGGTIRNSEGVITSPFFPGHYPANKECIWDIQVPGNKFVKLRFNMFYLLEPGVPVSSCTKDYVEINNQRYCGEKQPFVVSSNSNKMMVRFRSDQSHTDTGFTAQYVSYDSENPCPDQYTCKSGRCISKERRCDGWNDCIDFSDELNCNCTADQFRCKTSTICKPRFFLCDGVNDCGDSSDEQDCKCPENNFKCANGKCIPNAQKCDKNDNCGDGSDELDCPAEPKTACTELTYKCKNNECISKTNPECDGEKDCADGSDEDADNCNCGKRPYTRKTRIVGGVNADIGEFPWQVSLHTKKDGHTCGASLVSPTILISAAHCFQDMQGTRYSDPSLWTAFLGLHDQKQRTTSKDVVERSIKRIVPHRSFNDYTYDNDIAMLELSSPVTYTDFIQPICIPESSHNFPVGKGIWVTGWGALSEGGSGSVVLQKAEIRVINYNECNKLLDNQLTARMLCAGFVSGGIDACQGDSGGPLSSLESNNKMYLAGIVSWGDGCARRNKPGVYTSVTNMRDWIRQNTGL
ncbi:suppressor of tumorigenicity 14 protein [Spea bombifrons]|uniref:suppressor of tumorigenicity 14 protein n=1 Tax=Spea bombifrons TaxID=233779 RepID=UPI00234A31EE|nr:suppressor of tumorigenicity 14 protein [Spea bombifrons]